MKRHGFIMILCTFCLFVSINLSNATSYTFSGIVTQNTSSIFPVSVGDQFTGFYSYEFLTKPFAATLYHPPDIHTDGAIYFESFSVGISEYQSWNPYIRYSRDFFQLEWEPGIFTGLSGVTTINDILLYSQTGTYFFPNKLPKKLNLSNFDYGLINIEAYNVNAVLWGTIYSIEAVSEPKGMLSSIRAVPEPSTMILLGLGLLSMACLTKRRS